MGKHLTRIANEHIQLHMNVGLMTTEYYVMGLCELEGCSEDVVVIYPDLKLKDKWIEKLRLRYENTLRDKEYKAWKNAEDRYEDNIRELMAEDSFDHIVIEDMNYSLRWLLMNREIKR